MPTSKVSAPTFLVVHDKSRVLMRFIECLGMATHALIFRTTKEKRKDIKSGKPYKLLTDLKTGSSTMEQDATKYTYRVQWSEEDGEYLATVAEFPSLSWLEENQADAFEGIIGLVRDVINDMINSGERVPVPFSMREYSGNVRLRMPPEQHREFTIRAAEEGVSLNRLLCSLLARPTNVVPSSAKINPVDAMDSNSTSTANRRLSNSITVKTEAPHSRDSLKLVGSDDDTISSASGTEQLQSSSAYDQWPEEM